MKADDFRLQKPERQAAGQTVSIASTAATTVGGGSLAGTYNLVHTYAAFVFNALRVEIAGLH